MHTIQFKLDTTEYQNRIIEKRFYAICHIHNVMVSFAKRCLDKLESDENYEPLRKEYSKLCKIKKEDLTKEQKAIKADLSKKLSDLRTKYGLTRFNFHAYIKICGKRYSKLISSQQAQKEADRIWTGVEKVLFSNGEELHYKKFHKIRSICGKTNTNGIKFDIKTFSIDYMGLNIRCIPSKDISYMAESLNHKISYCEIKRMIFPNGYHYYVTVYLDGDAPKKLINVGSPDNITGVDIGVSTVATASDDKLTLKELAPNAKDYNKEIIKLSRHLDNSKRISNPDNYNKDGTIKKNAKSWKYSKSYKKALCKLKSLYRQKAAYIKQSHNIMINELLENSTTFIVENMSFKGLQRKVKKTERSDKVSNIKHKDGSVKQVHKYKKKKRFGKSLNNRAPASFIAALTRKAQLYGGNVYKVDTKEFRASQYDHIKDQYIKKTLKDRVKYVGDYKVQRDLYSAFLLKYSNFDLTRPDREKCLYGFDSFLKMQNILITEMKQQGISMKSCFGF